MGRRNRASKIEIPSGVALHCDHRWLIRQRYYSIYAPRPGYARTEKQNQRESCGMVHKSSRAEPKDAGQSAGALTIANRTRRRRMWRQRVQAQEPRVLVAKIADELAIVLAGNPLGHRAHVLLLL